VLAPERRAELLDWAATRGAYVLEDDYDGEFRYERGRLGALQGLAPAHTIYLGSTSKTLAPALRLGWMVLPAELAAAAAEEKAWADGGSPAIDQLAFADLIACGDLDRHLRRIRVRFRRRRDVLLEQLATRLPDVSVSGAAAGLHLLATLPEGTDLTGLLKAAWQRGVGVYGYKHSGRAFLLLGYANCPEPSIEPGVRELAAAYTGLGTSTNT
jgi:GntR family transcriptional regulator/MocR family aminotransferase